MYSSVDEVIKYTGAEYDKLNLNDQEELNNLIETWLIQIKSLIDRNRGRDLYLDPNFGDKIGLGNFEGELSSDVPKSNYYVVTKITSDSELDIDYDFTKAKTLEMLIKPESDVSDLKIELWANELVKTINLPSIVGGIWNLTKSYLGMNKTLKDIKKLKLINSHNLLIADIYVKQIPEGIHNIALRMCANMVKLAYANRQSPLVRIDEYNAQLLTDEIFTDELKKELRQYPKKFNVGMKVL